jgi:hypothetical protein
MIGSAKIRGQKLTVFVPLIKIIGLACISLLTACAGTRADRNTHGQLHEPWQLSIRPPFYDVEQPKHLTQLITISYKEQVNAIPFYIDLSTTDLTVSAVAPWGSPLFTLRYDGKEVSHLQTSTEGQGLDPEYVLSDMLLAYWPVSLLLPELAKQQMEITDKGEHRKITKGERTLVDIWYSLPDQKWSSTIKLEQLDLGYQISIQPLSEENYQ